MRKYTELENGVQQWFLSFRMRRKQMVTADFLTSIYMKLKAIKL